MAKKAEDRQWYSGIQGVKAAGVQHEYTPEEIKEYIKCAQDPAYFINNYVKIVSLDHGLVPFKMYPYQTRVIDAVHANRRVVAMMARQLGKSTVMSAYMLWYATFNERKTAVLLANKMKIAQEIFSKIREAHMHLPPFLQQGVVEWNKSSLKYENGSRIVTAATSPTAVRGMSCVTGDMKVCVSVNNDVYFINIDKFAVLKETLMTKRNSDHFKYYVYKLTNKINGMVYIGFHGTDNFDDGYMGSGKYIKAAVHKYGPENFTKEALASFDSKEEAEAYEQKLVDKEFTLREDTYNINVGGNVRISYGINNGFYGKSHTEEFKEYKRQAMKGNTNSFSWQITDGVEVYDSVREFAKAMSITKNIHNNVNYFCGDPSNLYHFIDEDRQREAEAFYIDNNIKNDQKRKKLSEMAVARFTGYEWSSERNEKISKTLSGREHPWQDKINKNPAKIAKTAEKHRGMKRSEEAKLKMSLAKKGKKPSNYGKGVAYDSTGRKHYVNICDKLQEGWTWSINTLKKHPHLKS